MNVGDKVTVIDGDTDYTGQEGVVFYVAEVSLPYPVGVTFEAGKDYFKYKELQSL